MNIQQFQTRADQLLTKRGMMPGRKDKVIIKSFREHFHAQAWYYHSIYGDGAEMFDLLIDDQLLIGGERFNSNFYEEIFEQPQLKTNKTWQSLKPSLIQFKGERIGAGEFYFPFVIQGWEFSKDGGKGDGFVAGGKREIKFGGASLKPTKNPSHRAIDRLNQTVFKGNRPGPEKPGSTSRGQSWDRWYQWFQQQKNPKEILTEYFTELYPDHDISGLVDDLLQADTCRKMYDTVGRYVLDWYKKIDGWDSLVIIDLKKNRILNIADVTDLSKFPKLEFAWVTARSGDVRQHADGYVNVKI